MNSPVRTGEFWRSLLPRVVGLLAGLAVAGWTFHGSFLLNWDLVVGPDIPIPPGLWGLGPELPRRTPMYVPLSVLSSILGGPRTVGILILASISGALIGMEKLSRDHGGGTAPDVVGTSIGLAYAISPFVLSRVAVGHLPLMVAVALLPWLLIGIDERSRRSLIRWASIFGLLGSSGAVLGLIPIGIALLRRSARRSERGRQVLWLGMSQACWVLPGLVAVAGGVPLPELDAAAFDLSALGSGGFVRVFAGGGLFLGGEDVAVRSGAFGTMLGLVTLSFGVVGMRRRMVPSAAQSLRSWPTIVWAGCAGTALVFVTSVPLIGDLWRMLVGLGPLGVLRETHKFWPLLGIPMLLGVGSFLRSFCGDVQAVLISGVVALVVLGAWPGLFGAEGRLDASPAPAAWSQVEQVLEQSPGRTVVFPWRRYDALDLAGGRTTLQPAPWTMSGTILTSADVGNADFSLEHDQIFEVELADLDRQIRAGKPVAASLRALRIDRVIVFNSEESGLYRRLGKEAGVSAVVDGPELWLYEIHSDEAQEGTSRLGWNGSALPAKWVSEPAVWDRSCERGWFLNWSKVERSNGVCDLGAKEGLLWYPPALVSMAGLPLTFGPIVRRRSHTVS